MIAEALGGGKSTKSVKVKDNLKKDKYLFKRRDDPGNSLQVAYREETPDAAGGYILQKRTPSVPVKPYNLEKSTEAAFISPDIVASTSDAKEALIGQVQTDGHSLASQAISSDAKPHPDMGKESSDKMFEKDSVSIKNLGRSDLSSTVDESSQSSHLESKMSVDAKHDENAKVSGPSEDIKQAEQGLLAVVDGGNDMHPVKRESIVKAKLLKNSAVKKIKGLKRPAGDLNSVTFGTGERKKKKKKDLNLQPMSDHLEKHSTSVKFAHLPGKPGTTDLAPREGLQTEQVQTDVNARSLLPTDTLEDVNSELPQLLGDLQALALDPFHGSVRKIPAAVRKFFLRFRSLVYQKSLVLSPPSENETPEVRVTKSPASIRISDSPDDHVRASPPVKHIVRPDDPTKAGRKRAPSDRQEEIAAKRLKKIKNLKALAEEKAAANSRASEARREDAKESQSQAPAKFVKPDSYSQAPSKFVKPGSAKKMNRPSKTVEPTTLVIKFPPQTSLPSVAELKARFARFGPMDQSGFRVFWKSLTCRVVFLHKADALAAYKYSVANQSLFGSGGVRCFLRESEDSAPEVSEAAKVRGDDGTNETPRVKDPVVHRPASVSSSHQPLPQPAIPLKSCLKKSTGDEPGQVAGNGSISKGNPRVKFMLGGEESSRGEQLMVGNKNYNNASFADDGGAPPFAMDFNSKNVQKVTSQLPPPIIPLATKNPQHNMRNFELAMAPRNSPNFINTTTTTSSAPATPVDISQQMITLLTRCSDVVNNLTGLLGYVPYHQL